MAVRMVDVAKALGVSKATVSLAVNNKPGVNAQTRKRILDYIEAKEKEEQSTIPEYRYIVPGDGMEDRREISQNPGEESYGRETEKNNGQESGQTVIREPASLERRMIKILVVNHQKKIVQDPALDLWSGAISTLDAACRMYDYTYSFSFLNDTDSSSEKEKVLNECNSSSVSGVILFGTEMESADEKLVSLLHVPVVSYDYDIPGNTCSSVVIDNELASRLAVKRLADGGAAKILYLANSRVIYNFKMRRRGFYYAMLERGLDVSKEAIIPLGADIDEIMQNAMAWSETHEMPDALVFENYQVSVGVINALRHRKIHVPEDIRYVGIDEVPGYFIGGGTSMTQIRIPHEERVRISVRMLNDLILGQQQMTMKVFGCPVLIEGESG